MSKAALNETRIKNAKRGDKLRDGSGLYLEIRTTGAKLWRYRYKIDGRENLYALGNYAMPAAGESEAEAQERRNGYRFSLKEARIERDHCRALVKQGTHPAHYRKAGLQQNILNNGNTVKAVCERWLEKRPGKKIANWSAATLAEAQRMIEKDVYPVLGARPIKSITVRDLSQLLAGIADRGATTVAVALFSHLRPMFKYAKAQSLIDADPCDDVDLGNLISVKPATHHAHLTPEKIPGVIAKLKGYRGEPSTRIALSLLMLTFVRKGELRQAKWGEFDLDAQVWNIPAERMKNKRAHAVPLSSQVVALLRELHKLTGARPNLFPNRRRPLDCMADRTLNAAVDYLGFGEVFAPHGLRGTASTALNTQGFHADVIERQLAHVERNRIRGAYNHADYWEERKHMMQAWADYLDALCAGANVIPIRKRAA